MSKAKSPITGASILAGAIKAANLVEIRIGDEAWLVEPAIAHLLRRNLNAAGEIRIKHHNPTENED